MSTHNIGFNEEMAKNYLSIIIKYAPYLFFCIRTTSLYNEDPLTPHFYIEKLGFTGVYIIFLFLL